MKKLIFLLFITASFQMRAQVSVYNSAPVDVTPGVRPVRELPIYDIAVLNYSDLKGVSKLKKVEFGINLNSEIRERIELFLAGDKGSFPLNPFIADDLNPSTSELAIHATFIHSQSKMKKERDFFYYHAYEQVGEDWNGWSDKINAKNDYMMRVRFAPPLSGEWQVKVNMMIDEKTLELPPFTFQVQESDHPGYVQVHENKRNLKLNDQVVFPLGHVFPGPYNRAKGGQTPWGEIPNGSQANTTVGDWNQYHQDIQSYIQQGGKSLKLVQTSYGNLIEFEEKGNYIKRMHYAWEQDKILDLCESNNVLINFNLLFQDVIMGYGQNGSGNYGDPWDYGNYGPEGPVPFSADYFPTYCYFKAGTLPSHQFLDSILMNYHKQRTRYYVARYGYSPQIYTWELLSEPFHMDEFNRGKLEINDPDTGQPLDDSPERSTSHPGHKVAIEAINNYHNVLSNYIKNELKDKDHLITLQQAIVSENDAVYPYACAYNPNIDIIGYNYYSARPNKIIVDKKDNNGKNNNEIESDETSLYKMFYDKFKKVQKPIIFSESGFGNTEISNSCYGNTGHISDVMTLCFSGIAGIHPWEGYQYGNYNQYDERLLWPSTISSEKFMNSEKVIAVVSTNNGKWEQGRQIEKFDNSNESYPKEIQYYVSEDKQSSAGYVSNRTYNIYSVKQGERCELDKNVSDKFKSPILQKTPITYEMGSAKSIFNRFLYVTGLEKKATYEVKWYDYETGILMSESQIQRTDGKSRLKLHFPELTVENPVRPILWYTVQKLDD